MYVCMYVCVYVCINASRAAPSSYYTCVFILLYKYCYMNVSSYWYICASYLATAN